jgi:excisionase family DNA binding protein
MPKWLTVKQVAEYLQMSGDKIYDMAQKGELPASKVRSQWRFDQDEIDAWVRSQRHLSASPTMKSTQIN